MLKDCCNHHDECYSVCGGDKTECDLELQKCAHNACHQKAQEEARTGEDIPDEVLTGDTTIQI